MPGDAMRPVDERLALLALALEIVSGEVTAEITRLRAALAEAQAAKARAWREGRDAAIQAVESLTLGDLTHDACPNDEWDGALSARDKIEAAIRALEEPT